MLAFVLGHVLMAAAGLNHGDPLAVPPPPIPRWGSGSGGWDPADPRTWVTKVVWQTYIRKVVARCTFRLDFHRFDRFELDLRGHTRP